MGSLLGNKAPPPPAPPPVAPVPDQAALTAAQQQAGAVLAQRTGRQSTLLSPTYQGTSDKLGS